MSTQYATAEYYGEVAVANDAEGALKIALIVIRDPAIAEELAASFTLEGYHAYAVTNGLEALYFLDHTVPDVIVLDLDVPVVSGFRLLRLAKRDAQTRHVPVLVVSDLSFQESRDAVLAGADDFLMVPVPAEEVVCRAQHLVARSRREARPRTYALTA